MFLFFFFKNEDASEGNKEGPGDGDEGCFDGRGTTKALVEKEEGDEGAEELERKYLENIFKGNLLFKLRLSKENSDDDG